MKSIHTIPKNNAHLRKMSIFLFFYFLHQKGQIWVHMCPPKFNELIPEHVYATQGSIQVGDLYARKSLNDVAL